MAGGPGEVISLGIYDCLTGKTIFIEENAFDEERYLTNITWDPLERFVYVAVLNRAQNHMMLNKYDIRTGRRVQTLFEERSGSYVEPLRGPIFHPADPEQFIWFSERDGFDHIYLYKATGQMVRQLTSGNFVVTDFAGWDPRGRAVYVTTTEVSPLERHFYRVDLQTGNRTRLTADAGNHQVQVSPDGKHLIDNYSNYKVPRRTLLADERGREIRKLFDAPDPLANIRLGEYKPLTIKSADRKTDLHGFMILPPGFDPARKYPVVVYVYGGPHAQLVLNQWLGGASGWQYYMAQQGYIAFTLDNRGSDARGRDFEQVIHRNLGQAEMADQLEGIRYLYSLPYVDQERIGAHGWSYGGFMTVSLMLNHPDIFRVGVAGGPVIDWKYYEVMYGERYMDTPQENPDGYELSSTLNKVRNLRGRLMLIHGDIDPVVVMQNSLDFLRKAISEGKLVDFMVYPQHEHNVRGRDRIHLMRTVTRYFEDHL
jgi:dipeptidyl-peptidase-4